MLRDRLRRWLRGEPAQAATLAEVGRATVFGSAADAARAAELWALRVKEAEQAEAERQRVAQSAKEIADACAKEGVWYPVRGRWGRPR